MSTAQRGVHRATEEQLFGHAVDHRDEGDQQQAALVGELQHPSDGFATVDLADDQPAHHERRRRGAAPIAVPVRTGRWLRPRKQCNRDGEDPTPGRRPAHTAARPRRQPEDELSPGGRVNEYPSSAAPITNTTATTDAACAAITEEARGAEPGRRRQFPGLGQPAQARRGGLGHAGIPFGTRPIAVSSPVRTAAATGPGTAPMSPSTGRTNGRGDRSGQLLNAQGIPACPHRIGVGQVVRVGERVDGNTRTARRAPG